MKIGNLDFKDYAAKKPIGFSPTGEFQTIEDAVRLERVEKISLFALDIDKQKELALARYNLEPEFKLAYIGAGILTKDEAMENIEAMSPIGQQLVQAEMSHCNDLMSFLADSLPVPIKPEIPPFPVIPKEPWVPVKRCIYLRVKNRALFCENTTDGVTSPFAAYRIANVHPVFSTAGFSVVVQSGADDDRTHFIPNATNNLTTYISGIGHGNYTTYTGHMGNHILEVGHYDPTEVNRKSIHFLSCETAGQLGPDTVDKGARSYMGYSENFWLQWDDPKTPAVDEFRLFAQCDSTYDIFMAHGATPKQAYDATIAMFNWAITQVPGTVAAGYLTYDRDHCRLIGDENAKVVPYRFVKICFPLLDIKRENALIMAGELMDSVEK